MNNRNWFWIIIGTGASLWLLSFACSDCNNMSVGCFRCIGACSVYRIIGTIFILNNLIALGIYDDKKVDEIIGGKE